MNFKGNWEPAIYCYARFWLWSHMYFLIFLFVFFLFFMGSGMFMIGEYTEYKVWPSIWELTTFFGFILSFLGVIILILSRLALDKVFFEKYKKFEIQADFEKITWKFSLLFSGKCLLVNLLAIAIIIIPFLINSNQTPHTLKDYFAFIESLYPTSSSLVCLLELSLYIAANFVKILILKNTIEKNATISLKS